MVFELIRRRLKITTIPTALKFREKHVIRSLVRSKMDTWFCKPKTESLLTLRADSTVPPDPISHAEPNFFLVPDGILGECLSDDCELVARFLSAIAGHIMESAVSTDSMRKITVPKPPTMARADEEDDSEKNFISEDRKLSLSKKEFDEGEESSQGTEDIETNLGRKSSKAISEVKKELISEDISTGGESEDDRRMKEEEVTEEITAVESTVETFEDDGSIKKPEITYKRKRYPSTMELDKELATRVFREVDQNADIVFTNNNRFQGRLSRMLMEGFGTFTWKNGQTYKGTFKKNRAEGLGEITWNDGSTYEGQVKDGLRHGRGIKTYIASGVNGEKVKMYHSGEWKNGKKHGQGKSVYGKNDWYDGEWYEGLKTGFGIRHYPSGARYEGYWFCGHRHGQGTMVWPNCDVYAGEWQWGYMNGWGKYTWGGSFNENFAAPQSNSYSGHWDLGQRDGQGILELSTGAVIRTYWENGQKMGTADVNRRNGSRVIWSNLFDRDQILERNLTPSELECNLDKLKMTTFDEDEPTVPGSKRTSVISISEKKVAQTVPINIPVTTMDFTMHIDKLFNITSHTILPLTIIDLQPPIFPIEEKDAVTSLESYWLKKIVTRQMKNLTRVYNYFALIFHPSPSSLDYLSEHRVVLLRFMLWALLKNCGLADTGLNTYQVDKEVGMGFDPLDKVQMFEMIHYLLFLSWHLYARKRLKNPTIPGILGASFDVFMEKVVISSIHRYDGSCLKLLKHVPLEPMYKLYKTFKHPLLIEDFCERVLYLAQKTEQNALPPVTPEYFRYILRGKNIIGADGFLKYIAYEVPHFDFEKMKLTKAPIDVADLNLLGIIGMDNVVRCIQKVVPDSLEPETQQPRSDYELSFVDFCEILANMALVYVDLGENFCALLKLREDEEAKSREEALRRKEEEKLMTEVTPAPKRKSPSTVVQQDDLTK